MVDPLAVARHWRAWCGVLTVSLISAGVVSLPQPQEGDVALGTVAFAAPPREPLAPAAQPAAVATAKPPNRPVRMVGAPSGVRLTISAPMYDAPGATVPAIATIGRQSQPGRVRFTMWGSGGASAVCSRRTWRNPHDRTISQTCLFTLPRHRATVSLSARAVVTRGDRRYVVRGNGSRPVYARGPRSRALSLAQITEVERCGNDSGRVWLTFDDGTTPAILDSILATLRRQRVRGVFLWTGRFAHSYPQLVRRVVRAGHWLGNHSETHVPLSDAPSAVVRREIRRGVRATTTPRIMRPPFAAGAFSRRLVRLAAEQDFVVCRWTADTAEWSDLSAPAQIVRRVRFGDRLSPPLRRGGVLLMHATVAATAQALPRIIEVVREKGYPLASLPRHR